MPRGGGQHMDMDLHYMRPRECESNYLGTLRSKTRRLGPRPPYRAFVGLRNPRYGLKRVLRIFGTVCVRLYWSESCMRMGSRGGSRIQRREFSVVQRGGRARAQGCRVGESPSGEACRGSTDRHRDDAPASLASCRVLGLSDVPHGISAPSTSTTKGEGKRTGVGYKLWFQRR